MIQDKWRGGANFHQHIFSMKHSGINEAFKGTLMQI